MMFQVILNDIAVNFEVCSSLFHIFFSWMMMTTMAMSMMIFFEVLFSFHFEETNSYTTILWEANRSELRKQLSHQMSMRRHREACHSGVRGILDWMIPGWWETIMTDLVEAERIALSYVVSICKGCKFYFKHPNSQDWESPLSTMTSQAGVS